MPFKRGNQEYKKRTRESPGRPTKEEAAAKEEMVRIALDTLKAGMADAVQTLLRLLHSESEPIQARAAENIVNFALKCREQDELEQRIAALEEKLIQQGGNHR